MDMRAGELAKHNLDFVAVQSILRVEGSSQAAGDFTCFYGNGNGNANRHLVVGFFIHKGIIPAVKRVEIY
jgi:hypothetical protein